MTVHHVPRQLRIGVFISEYYELISNLNLPFDVNILLSSFISYNKGIITYNELYNSLYAFANDILELERTGLRW